MLNQSVIRKFITSYQKQSELKHKLKTVADKVRMLSKHGISLMRNEKFQEGTDKLKEAERELKNAQSLINKEPSLREEGFFRDSVEEYVEAKAYESFLKHIPLKFPTFISIGSEEAIGGIIDFTGELVRKTLNIADSNNLKTIQSYINITESIMTEFSRTSFSGKLREKYDDLERNLSKLERMAYELRVKK